MVCDCCGRRKKIFESFAAVKHGQTQMNFCVECNDLPYKIRDDANEQNSDSYEKHLKEWKKRAKKPPETYLKWQQVFLISLEKNTNKDKT